MPVLLSVCLFACKPSRKNSTDSKRICKKFNVAALVNGQLDAQIFYFIMRLLQSSTCFEQRRAHHQEVKLY